MGTYLQANFIGEHSRQPALAGVIDLLTSHRFWVGRIWCN